MAVALCIVNDCSGVVKYKGETVFTPTVVEPKEKMLEGEGYVHMPDDAIGDAVRDVIHGPH